MSQSSIWYLVKYDYTQTLSQVWPAGPHSEDVDAALGVLLHAELPEPRQVEEEREAEYRQVGNVSAIGGHVPAGQGSIL